MKDGTVIDIENPSRLPDLSKIDEIREAHHYCDNADAAGIRRPCDDALQSKARRASQHGIPRPAGNPEIRHADE